MLVEYAAVSTLYGGGLRSFFDVIGLSTLGPAACWQALRSLSASGPLRQYNPQEVCSRVEKIYRELERYAQHSSAGALLGAM